MMAHTARHNYHQESEAGVNKQINLELYASYVFQSMAYHFDRDDVAMSGFFKFFKKMSDQEREDALQLMEFQNQRGGRLVMQDIQKPMTDDWGTGLEAMQAAHELAKNINTALKQLHDVAAKHGDSQMTDFMEGTFLHKQTKMVKEIADHLTNLRKVGHGLGEYQFDKETLKESS